MELLGKTPLQGALAGMSKREMWQLLKYYDERPETKAARYIVAFLTDKG